MFVRLPLTSTWTSNITICAVKGLIILGARIPIKLHYHRLTEPAANHYSSSSFRGMFFAENEQWLQSLRTKYVQTNLPFCGSHSNTMIWLVTRRSLNDVQPSLANCAYTKTMTVPTRDYCPSGRRRYISISSHFPGPRPAYQR